MPLGAATVLTVALMLLFERPHAVWTVPAVASLAWNVLAVSIGAMAFAYYMLNRGSAGRARQLLPDPGDGGALAWALVTPLVMVGFAIASLGVFLAARSQPKEQAVAPRSARPARKALRLS